MKRRVGILVATGAAMLAFAPTAQAARFVTPIPVFTVDPATVPSTGNPGTLIIEHEATDGQNGSSANVTAIRLTPSCTDVTSPPCPLDRAEPGAITISPTATGGFGTACQGKTFTVGVIDNTTGEVLFDTENTLDGYEVKIPDGGECRINFTYNVNRLTADGQAEDGVQTNQNFQVTIDDFDPFDFLGNDITTLIPAATPASPVTPPVITPAPAKKCKKGQKLKRGKCVKRKRKKK